jgi:hypothetical protein
MASAHLWLKVINTASHRVELGVVGFRDFNAVSFAEFHDDVEEIHGVQIDLITEGLIVFEIAQVFVWGDVGYDVDDGLARFFGGQGVSYGFVNMTTELIPSIPNELLRM